LITPIGVVKYVVRRPLLAALIFLRRDVHPVERVNLEAICCRFIVLLKQVELGCHKASRRSK
jgi:hypothetical protein